LSEISKETSLLKRPRRRIDVQALRGVSVLAVVLFHASNRFIPNGFLGVDVFFVISGFVVTPLIKQLIVDSEEDSKLKIGNTEVIKFFKRRFLRLTPALGFTLILTSIMMIAYLPPHDLGRFAKQGISTLFLLGNLGAYHFIGDYFFPNPNPLVHMWSLSAEEQIYILLPLSLLLYLKAKHVSKSPTIIIRKILLYLGLISILSFLLIGLYVMYVSHSTQNLANFNFYSFSGRIWEFALGGGIFLFLEHQKPLKLQRLKLIKAVFLFAIILILLWPNPIGTPIGEFGVCLLSIPFLVTVDLKQSYGNAILVWLGDRSYSIYLIHMPLLYLAYFSPHWSDGSHRRSGKILALILTFIVATFMSKYIENRFRVNNLDESISPKKIVQASCYFFIFPLAILSLILAGSNGNFFGLDKNPVGPRDPGSLDRVCYQQLGSEPCIYIDTQSNGRYALLVGDSHARHLSIGFIAATQKAGFTPVIWTQSGCQFVFRSTATSLGWQKLIDAWGHQGHFERQSCFSHNDEILKWVQSNPTARVFVTHRSTSFPVSAFQVDPKQYNNAILRDIQKLRTKSNTVTLIGPNPEFPDGTKFFAGNTLLWEHAYEPTAAHEFPIREMIQNPFNDDKQFKSTTLTDGINYISIINLFCTSKGLCNRFSEHGWLFANGDHLSIEGSRLVEADIERFLSKF